MSARRPDRAVHCEAHGEALSGGTVLLSSGLGGAGSFWAPQLEALCRRHRVVTYDQRGTGRSAGPLPDPYSISAMADDVVEILDELGIARCHFVGHALGGLVGLDLALRRPGRVASLVLVNAWARGDAHTLRCFDVRRDLLRIGPEAYVRAQPLFLYPAPWMSRNAERLARELHDSVTILDRAAEAASPPLSVERMQGEVAALRRDACGVLNGMAEGRHGSGRRVEAIDATLERLRAAMEAEPPGPDHEVQDTVAFGLGEVRRTLARLIDAQEGP